MKGETNLLTLVQNMRPELNDGEFVSCSLDPAGASEICLSPVGQYVEKEGLTLLFTKDQVKGLDSTFACRRH